MSNEAKTIPSAEAQPDAPFKIVEKGYKILTAFADEAGGENGILTIEARVTQRKRAFQTKLAKLAAKCGSHAMFKTAMGQIEARFQREQNVESTEAAFQKYLGDETLGTSAVRTWRQYKANLGVILRAGLIDKTQPHKDANGNKVEGQPVQEVAQVARRALGTARDRVNAGPTLSKVLQGATPGVYEAVSGLLRAIAKTFGRIEELQILPRIADLTAEIEAAVERAGPVTLKAEAAKAEAERIETAEAPKAPKVRTPRARRAA